MVVRGLVLAHFSGSRYADALLLIFFLGLPRDIWDRSPQAFPVPARLLETPLGPLPASP